MTRTALRTSGISTGVLGARTRGLSLSLSLSPHPQDVSSFHITFGFHFRALCPMWPSNRLMDNHPPTPWKCHLGLPVPSGLCPGVQECPYMHKREHCSLAVCILGIQSEVEGRWRQLGALEQMESHELQLSPYLREEGSYLSGNTLSSLKWSVFSWDLEGAHKTFYSDHIPLPSLNLLQHLTASAYHMLNDLAYLLDHI